MNIYINKSITVGLLIGLLISCDLDTIPPTDIPDNSFWKTEADANNGLNTCYSFLKGIDIWDEMCTDNAHSHKPWEGNFEIVQQGGVSTAATYGSYNFEAVRSANVFIEKVETCEIDENLKDRMKAEARFFRAFSYLDLTQYYGKVPIITEVLAYDAPNVARNSVEEVRKFILDELEAIATILPESYSGEYLHEKGRITRYAALALRARAALYFGNYPEAEKSAEKVIQSGKYSLFRVSSLTEPQAQEAVEMNLYIDFEKLGIDKDKFVKGIFSYDGLWQGSNADVSNPEFVLTREYNADSKNYDAYRYTYFIPLSMAINHGYSSYEPMQDLVDAYWSIDGKTVFTPPTVSVRKANFDKIWSETKNLTGNTYKEFVTSTKLMSYEYMQEFRNRDSRLYASIMFPYKGWHASPKGEFYYKWDPDVIDKNGNESWTGFSYRKLVSGEPYDLNNASEDYPTIRYAEVLLKYAEARLMNTGYDAEVQKALNEIRDRCGMPNVPTSLSKDEAINFLRNERRIELAVEGHRYDDVRRYGSEYCKKYLNGPSTAPNGEVVVDKKWDNRMMLMPIPTSAIDNNPLLKDDQNPGY